MNPWAGIVGCLVLLILSMAALSAWRRRRRVSPEVVRKILHVEMGLVASAAPWAFDALWPVLVLAGLAALWFRAAESYGPLSRRFRGALGAARRRRSRGEFFFVGGILAAYVLSRGEPVYYCSAVAALTLADTAAALVGGQLGRHTYGAARKTLEGSGAFLAVAFVCIAACVALLSADPAAPNLAPAATAAVTATLLEAGSRGGADNLLVPVGVVAVLRAFLDTGSGPLLILLIACAAMFVVASIVRPGQRGSHENVVHRAVE